MGFMFDKGTPWPFEVLGGQLKIVICRSNRPPIKTPEKGPQPTGQEKNQIN